MSNTELTAYCERHGIDAGRLWNLFVGDGTWPAKWNSACDYLHGFRLSVGEIVEANRLLFAAYDAPAAPISGTDAAPTAPVAALEPPPTSPKPESADAMWRRVLGLPAETADAQPESVQEAAPAQETGKATGDEGARLTAILGCPEARGRQAFAEHIAFYTELGVEHARLMLAASPTPAPAPSKPAPAPAPATRPTAAPAPVARPEAGPWGDVLAKINDERPNTWSA